MCLPLPITLLPTFVHDCLRHFVLLISRRLGGAIFCFGSTENYGPYANWYNFLLDPTSLRF
jgi:hypothetical protein